MKMKNVNFFDQRKEKMKELHNEGKKTLLEETGGNTCDKHPRMSDGYGCGGIYYEGTLKFNVSPDNKKSKVKEEYMSNITRDNDAMHELLKCVSDRLGALPEFRQCHSHYIGSSFECESADHIRRSLTEGNLRTVARNKVEMEQNGIKSYRKWKKQLSKKGYYTILPSDKKEKQFPEVIEEQMERLDKNILESKEKIKELKSFMKDKETRKKIWDNVFFNSIYRGFFFNSVHLSLPYMGGGSAHLDVTGRIISPVHEFMEDEIEQVEKMASEALYTCVPEDARIGKRERKLEYFIDEE